MVHLVFFVSCVLGAFPAFKRNKRQQHLGVQVLPAGSKHEFYSTNKDTATRAEAGEKTFDLKQCQDQAPSTACKAWCTWGPSNAVETVPKSWFQKFTDRIKGVLTEKKVNYKEFNNDDVNNDELSSEEIWNMWKKSTKKLSKLADAFTKNKCETEDGIFRISGKQAAVKKLVQNVKNGKNVKPGVGQCHVIAGAIKAFLQGAPILKEASDECWSGMPDVGTEKAVSDAEDRWIQWFRKLPAFPAVHLMFTILLDVEENRLENQMTLKALGLGMGESLFVNDMDKLAKLPPHKLPEIIAERTKKTQNTFNKIFNYFKSTKNERKK